MQPIPSGTIVLNVGDVAPARSSRTNVLQQAGFEVVEAASASEATRAAAARQPRVALVDVSLPDADGFHLCARLKEALPTLSVVLVSARPFNAAARDKGLAAGAAAYLREPVSAEALVARTCDALHGVAPGPASPSWVITDATGHILDASPVAAEMLNVSRGRVRSRSLLVFFEADRLEWRRLLIDAARGQLVERSGWIRPRERRPHTVHVEVTMLDDHSDARTFLWCFSGESSMRSRHGNTARS